MSENGTLCHRGRGPRVGTRPQRALKLATLLRWLVHHGRAAVPPAPKGWAFAHDVAEAALAKDSGGSSEFQETVIHKSRSVDFERATEEKAEQLKRGHVFAARPQVVPKSYSLSARAVVADLPRRLESIDLESLERYAWSTEQ